MFECNNVEFIFQQMKIIQPILVIVTLNLIAYNLAVCQILSTVNFKSNNVVSAGTPNSRVVGLSMYFPQIIGYLNNSLFLARINLSRFDGGAGRTDNLFQQIIHVSKGYKYNCSTTIYAGSVSCIKDLILDQPLIKQMNKYISSQSNYRNFGLGYDIERSNFSNSVYMNNFKGYINSVSTQLINIELIDYGDQLISIYNRNYTVNNLITDIALINSSVGYPIYAPGITQSADSSWVNQLPNLTSNSYFTFTFRCTVFASYSDATIANLLSENYSGAYLKRRLVNSTGATFNLSTYSIGISQIRLMSGSGIDGVTNSFAAALWALDISMEMAVMKGKFINFYNPLTASNQSIFGAGPAFTPSPILYGLLFAIYALRDYPKIELTQIINGTSQNIKAYGVKLTQNYRVLIINKDTNANSSGVVNIMIDYLGGLRCYYLTAPSLSSTSGVSFAGMSFIGNSADYVGQFVYSEYGQTNSIYTINLNYSQAVLCDQIQSGPYTSIPRKTNFQYNKAFFILYFILLILYI